MKGFDVLKKTFAFFALNLLCAFFQCDEIRRHFKLLAVQLKIRNVFVDLFALGKFLRRENICTNKKEKENKKNIMIRYTEISWLPFIFLLLLIAMKLYISLHKIRFFIFIIADISLRIKLFFSLLFYLHNEITLLFLYSDSVIYLAVK